MAEAGFQQSAPATVDIPLAGMILNRATGTLDQRYVNVIFEKYKNPMTGGESIYCLKRPGLENFSQPPAGAATGRGLYYWEGSGKLYSVFGDKIYSNTTDLGVTLAGSSGRVWFAETGPTSSTRLLVVSDGTDNYNIETNDTITQIDETDDAQYPTPNVGSIVFLDTYLFQAQEDGELWNSDSDVFTSWLGTAVEDVDDYADELRAIARQKDQILAFGKYSLEFYYNNSHPTGSPLLRINQNSMGIGMAHSHSLAQSGEIIMWVAEAPANGEGTRSVWMIQGLQGTRVSPPAIERLITAEGTSISGCSAWMERVQGHTLYVLNLSSANRTLVYDVSMNMWGEWSNTSTAKFPGMAATSQNGIIYIQDATNGRVYKLNPTIYQDSGSNFTVTIQTDNYDFGTPFHKFQEGFWLVGDNTTGTINVSEADDDYITFNSARTIDMTTTRKFLGEGGAFFQRAFKLEYTQNAALRLQKLVLKLKVGNA